MLRKICSLYFFLSFGFCQTQLGESGTSNTLDFLRPKIVLLCSHYDGTELDAKELDIVQKIICADLPVSCQCGFLDLEEVAFLNMSAFYGLEETSIFSLNTKYNSDDILVVIQTLDKNFIVRSFSKNSIYSSLVFIDKETPEKYRSLLKDIFLKDDALPENPGTYFFNIDILDNIDRKDLIKFLEHLSKHDSVKSLGLKELSQEKVSFEVLAYWSPRQYERALTYMQDLFIRLD